MAYINPLQRLPKWSASLVLLLLVGALLAGEYPLFNDETPLISKIKEKVGSQAEKFPEERVYLHFDRPFYKPGDNIWFQAYLLGTKDFKASEVSDILHVELVDPKGNVKKSHALIAKDGVVSGDFALSAGDPGGMYKVRAFTKWQKNNPDALLFEKELQVQNVVLPRLRMKLDFERKAFGAGDRVVASLNLNSLDNRPLKDHKVTILAQLNGKQLLRKEIRADEQGEAFIAFDLPKDLETTDGLLNVLIPYEGRTESISRSIPIVLDKVDLSFYPEGGDPVAGLPTRIAFKALNEHQKPADIEGRVVDASGKVVTTFSSFHQGMGAFALPDGNTKDLKVEITKPAGITKQYTLPESLPKGYAMEVGRQNGNELPVTLRSTHNTDLTLIGKIHDQVLFARQFRVSEGAVNVKVPLENFPPGVAQFTVFDNREIARAERLTFVNRDKQLKVEISTDKESYLPREKVTATVRVTDEQGIPMPAQLSVSVVDDKLLSFADDRSGNILSHLLLESDVRGEVEEPAFYFDPEEEKAEQALEYVMMTSGWRRFTWEKVMSGDQPTYELPEQAVLSGVVYNMKNQRAENVTVELVGTGQKVRTDKQGVYTIRNADLSEVRTLKFSGMDWGPYNLQVNDYSTNLHINPIQIQNVYYKRERAAMKFMQEEAFAMPAEAGGMADGPNAVEDFDENEAIVEKIVEEDLEAEPMPVANKEVEKPEAKLKEKVLILEDNKDQMFADSIMVMDELVLEQQWAGNAQPIENKYYRAREFSAPEYKSDQQVELRTDFRPTVFWKPNLKVDRTGKATFEFYTSDEVTTFKITAEGFGGGLIGRGEGEYVAKLPFSLSCKMPADLLAGDQVQLPLTLKNTTDKSLSGVLTIKAPEGLKAQFELAKSYTIPAGEVRTLYFDYNVAMEPGTGNFKMAFKASGLSDAFTQEVRIRPKGFPVELSMSGQEMDQKFRFTIANPVEGSMEAKVMVYPNVVSDLVAGVESILREPYGCFEQTSTSNYPNVLALNYLKETGQEKPKLEAKALKLLEKGYQRLASFETGSLGFEWFGSSPGHEALTAYGLMQFSDMKKVFPKVDDKMVVRTRKWLMKRRDGKGGFLRDPKALDSFGRASAEVTNAYIVFALSEAGIDDISTELEEAYREVKKSKDPYRQALVVGALYNLNDSRADKLLADLIAAQDNDGSWKNAQHSITMSGGKSLLIETTAISVLALLKAEETNKVALNKAVKYLVASRSGQGGFGSTQGTILALKALTAYAKFSKRTSESGTVEVWIDDKKVGEESFTAGHQGSISVSGLGKYLKQGSHKLRVSYKGMKEPLPFSASVNYHTNLPNSSDECRVSLDTQMDRKKVAVGETVRLTSKLTNVKEEGMPMAMAVVGIPAGLSAQPWQLKEMQEKGTVDFYEVRGQYVIFYFRDLKPQEKHELKLDLKAEVPGTFDTPASSGYLYYTNEFKCWDSAGKITVTK